MNCGVFARGMALPNCILFTGDKIVAPAAKKVDFVFFGGIWECRPTGYIVNLHYFFCGRLIIAPTAGMVDFAVVLSFRGGIWECRPAESGGSM